MGFGKWWLTHGPGSPGSIAKAITKDYNKWKLELPSATEDELLLLTLENRIRSEYTLGTPPPNEYEHKKMLNQANGDLKKLILFIVHRENPEADKALISAPEVYFDMKDVIEDVVSKYLQD